MKKNKLMKAISILAAVIMAISAGMTVSAEFSETLGSDIENSSEITISLQGKEVTAGETVEIPLVMHTDNQCNLYDLLVEYDSRLEFVEVQGAKALNYEENGKKLVSLAGYAIEPYQDDTAIASITFSIPEDAVIGDTYNVDFARITSFSSDANEFENYTSLGAVISVSKLSNDVEKTTETTKTTNLSNNAVVLRDQNAVPGNTVEIPLVIYSNNQCTSYDVLVEYDSRLEFAGVSGAKASYSFEENGKKFISLASFETSPYKDGQTATTIKLCVPDDAENDNYDVKFDRITSLSTDFEDIENYRVENAIITVTGGVAKKSDASLEMKNVAGMAGDIAIVQVISNTRNRCSNYEAVIEYDSRLALEDVVGAGSFDKFEENGRTYVVISGSANGTFTDGELLAALIFRIPDQANTTDSFKVSFDKVNKFGTENGDFENYTTTNAVITVFKTTRPNDRIKDYKTFKKYDENGNLIAWRIAPRGDANGDGITNIRDAAAIAIHCALRHSGRKNVNEEGEFFGDVNDDGNMNIRDAAAIARYLAKGGITWDNIF